MQIIAGKANKQKEVCPAKEAKRGMPSKQIHGNRIWSERRNRIQDTRKELKRQKEIHKNRTR